MTQEQKNMKRYTQAIQRRLNLPRDIRARVMNDLISSIEERREAGQSDEAIFREMGTPKQVAAELNDQMKEYAYTPSPWRWVFLGIGIMGVLMAVSELLGILWLHQSMGIIGGADGPTAIFVSARVPASFWDIIWLLIPVAIGCIGFRLLSRRKKKQ